MISILPIGKMRLRGNWEAVINGFVLDKRDGEEREVVRGGSNNYEFWEVTLSGVLRKPLQINRTPKL